MRRLLAFLVLSIVASACSSAGDLDLVVEEFTTDSVAVGQSSEETSSPQPAALASGSAPETEREESCEALTEMIVDANNIVDNPDQAIARLIEVLYMIDDGTAQRLTQLIDSDAAEVDINEYLDTYIAVNEVTYAACEIPFITAVSAMAGGTTISSVCISGSIEGEAPEPTEESPRCSEEEISSPSDLPCFAKSDEPKLILGGRYEAVDCDTGEPVSWDHSAGKWAPGVVSPYEDLDGFRDIDYELAGPDN